MRIGLVDYDLYVKPSLKVLNVEVMKLGTYYEKKGCQVDILSPADSPFYYDKIIIVTNRALFNGKGTELFLNHPDIQVVGPAHNNSNYIPFENDEIDYEEPQFKFYNNLFKYFYKKGIYTLEDIKKLKEQKYIRIFPNKKSINIDKVLTGEKIYVTDNYIFDKDNWEEVVKYLAIFHRYFSFTNYQLVRNLEDLKNFKKMIDYGFIGLRAMVQIEKIDDLVFLLKEGKEIFDELAPTRFEWEIAYSENNNYNEKFYQQEFFNTLLKIQKFYEYKVEIRDLRYFARSNFEFTNCIFEALEGWGCTRKSTKYSFNEYIFLTIKKKKNRDLYLKFIEKHPEYKPLINIIYKKEEW